MSAAAKAPMAWARIVRTLSGAINDYEPARRELHEAFLTAREMLTPWGQVIHVSPLPGLVALQSLDLNATQVAEVSALVYATGPHPSVSLDPWFIIRQFPNPTSKPTAQT